MILRGRRAGRSRVRVALDTTWWALLGLAFLVPGRRVPWRSSDGASGRDLVPVLQLTGLAELAFGAGLFAGLFGWARRSLGRMTFLILLVLIVAGVVAYKNRVALLAKILGQPQSRIERRLNGPKR